MSSSKFVLIDEEFQKQAFNELKKIRSLLQNNKVVTLNVDDDELMDGIDLEKYLKCCRRTLYVMRKNGMPFIQKQNRRVYYWKSQVNEYLEKLNPSTHGN